MIPRHQIHSRPSIQQTSNLIIFQTTIHRTYPWTTFRIVRNCILKRNFTVNALLNSNNCYTFIDTSSTRFRVFGSVKITLKSPTGSSYTMRPKIVPFSRIFFVSSLVSTPCIPGIPSSSIHFDRVFMLFQWLGASQCSPTIKAAAHIRWDSNQLKDTKINISTKTIVASH